MEKYLLGLDGGGTKTDVIVCREDGCIVSSAVSGASSITGQTVEAAKKSICQAVGEALRPLNGLSTPISGFYAGISGCGLQAVRDRLLPAFNGLLEKLDHFQLGSDAANALSSGIGPGDGVIAIAGTGSSVYVRKNRVLNRVSGWGYLLGDEGSGYDLGSRAIRAALRSYSGVLPPTALVSMCREHAKGSLEDWVTRLYAGDSKKEIASVAPLLLCAASQGDEVALHELCESVGNLAADIRTAFSRCEGRQLVLSGSVWKSRIFCETLRSMLADDISMRMPELPPVCGSAVEAAALAGIPWNTDFIRNAKKTME